MSATSKSAANNIVLVHGGFVDGSAWEGVHKALRKDRFSVGIVQKPMLSLADDVSATRRVIAAFAPDKGKSVANLIVPEKVTAIRRR